jgi:hypothetical protein
MIRTMYFSYEKYNAYHGQAGTKQIRVLVEGDSFISLILPGVNGAGIQTPF